MKNNTTEYFIFGLFFFLGIFFFVITTCILGILSPKGKTEKAIATIVDLESYTDSEGERLYHPYLEYEVDGEKYIEKLNMGSSTYKIGNTMQIYYLLDDPTQIYSVMFSRIQYLFYILPLVFCLVGGIGLLVKIKEISKKKLVKTGKRVEARITNVDYNRNYTVNGRHPFRIYCTFTEIDGNSYDFVSGNLWENPQIDMNAPKMMPVYVDPKNYKKYYVNVEEYLNQVL